MGRLLSVGHHRAVKSGLESKASVFAQQKLEELKSIPFGRLEDGSDYPEDPDTTYWRSWTIQNFFGYTKPNRLAQISVTVTHKIYPPTTVSLTTKRAE